MRSWLLIMLLLLPILSGCMGSVPVEELTTDGLISCDTVKDPICSFKLEPVCAKIKLVGKVTDNIEWRDFTNSCKACQYSDSKHIVMGFEEGDCGLSDEEQIQELNPKASQEKGQNTGIITDSPSEIDNSSCDNKPPQGLVDMCNARNGKIKPMGLGCDVKFHCVVG